MIKVITQVGGGDEVRYNSGDGPFYVTEPDTSSGVQSLDVIDAENSKWLQNLPISEVLAAGPSPPPDVSTCTKFGF